MNPVSFSLSKSPPFKSLETAKRKIRDLASKSWNIVGIYDIELLFRHHLDAIVAHTSKKERLVSDLEAIITKICRTFKGKEAINLALRARGAALWAVAKPDSFWRRAPRDLIARIFFETLCIEEPTDLKSLRIVCKRWKEIADYAWNLFTENRWLTFSEMNDESKELFVHNNPSCRYLDLRGIYDHDTRLFFIRSYPNLRGLKYSASFYNDLAFTWYHPNVEQLTITGRQTDHLDLTKWSKLTHLELSSCARCGLVDLPETVKTIKIDNTNFTSIRLPTSARVQGLEIKLEHSGGVNGDIDLASSVWSELESLIINDYWFNNQVRLRLPSTFEKLRVLVISAFHTQMSISLPSKLPQLRVLKLCDLDTELISLTETLEEIEIGGCKVQTWCFPESFPNLKAIALEDVNNLPKTLHFDASYKLERCEINEVEGVERIILPPNPLEELEQCIDGPRFHKRKRRKVAKTE